ncbi:polysaccharide deacetylase family protein [Kiritimatiellaeota bacterium B1221]|nr:polysaccharide deacetylase family protein [Kiritimatiellaeota bacterium B1221]
MNIVRSILSLIFLSAPLLFAEDKPGTTRIAKWKDNKACAFILMFDDSSSTHVKHVFPELQKRNLTGTFYINPGSGHYGANRQFWEKTLPGAGFELGNHTMTHKGGDSKAEVEKEITDCNEVVHHLTPNAPWPRLVTFAKPGGLKKGKWPLTAEEQAALLAENHLIQRPSFSGRGAQVAFKTGDQMLAHVDKAVKNHSMECIIFHGVEGDWISTPLSEFIILLDGLTERDEQVWVTHHMAAYKYSKARDNAKVKILTSSPNQITLEVNSNLDPELYDQKLTLVTQVPATWKTVGVQQAGETSEFPVHKGTVLYEARPGNALITLSGK